MTLVDQCCVARSCRLSCSSTAMKKFFSRASKPPNVASVATPSMPSSSSTVQGLSNIPHLQPKYTVPAVPAPSPYDHIALLVTKEGLLLRPHGALGSSHGVKISWGKGGKVEEISVLGEWEGSVVVYGILGILELLSCAFTLRTVINLLIHGLCSFVSARNHWKA